MSIPTTSTWYAYVSGRANILDSTIDLSADVFKAVQLSSSYTPNLDTHTQRSDVAAAALGTDQTVTLSVSGDTVSVATGCSWAGGTSPRYVAIYDDTHANDLLVCIFDNGATQVVPTGATYTLTAQGLFTLPGIQAYNEPVGLTVWYNNDGSHNPASPPLTDYDNGVIPETGWNTSSGATGPSGQFKTVADGANSTDDFQVGGVAIQVPVNPTGSGYSLRIGHRGFGAGQHTAGELGASGWSGDWPVGTSVPSGSNLTKWYMRFQEYVPSGMPHVRGKGFFIRTPNGTTGAPVADMYTNWIGAGGLPGGFDGVIQFVAQGQTNGPSVRPTSGCYNYDQWHTTEIYMEQGSGVNSTWLLKIWVDGTLVVDSVSGVGYWDDSVSSPTTDEPFEWIPDDNYIMGMSFYPNVNSTGAEHDNALIGELYVSVDY